MEESFGKAVIDDFVQEYVAGRTPNPCVRCNSNTKIPDLLAARPRAGRRLHRHGPLRPGPTGNGSGPAAPGVDPDKDQSYFLWGMPAPGPGHHALPRGRAHQGRGPGPGPRAGPAHRRKAGVPGDLLRANRRLHRLPGRAPGRGPPRPQPGPSWWIRTARAVGQHDGYARYTVGQRKGLGGGFGQRLYVLGVRPTTQRGRGGGGPDLPDAGDPGRPQLAGPRPRRPGERVTSGSVTGDPLVAAVVEPSARSRDRLRLASMRPQRA
jgi:tRNA-uridine 2-sulfurtransferase